jgi:hypothetical protein
MTARWKINIAGMKVKIILYVVLVVIAFTAIIAAWMYFKPHTSVRNKEAAYKLSAKQLADAFSSNEEKANSLYTGKVLEVEGYLQEITFHDSTVILMLGDISQSNGVSCFLQEGSRNTQSLKAGNQVTVKGICSGFLLDVVVENCILLNQEE